jgi:protein transport protein SEC31
VPNGPNTNSEVYVHELVTEHTLVSRSTEFESVIKNGEKASLRALCEKKFDESKSEEEKETWSFLKVMFDEEGAARTKLLDHLGFSVPESQTVDSTNDLVKSLEDSLSFDNNSSPFPEARDSKFLVDNGEDFFNNPQPTSEDALVSGESGSSNETEQLKKDEEQKIPEVPSDPSVDESIQRALVVGDYKAAVAQCVAANRMADALVIANVGGPSLWESTRNLYLKNSVSSYLKIVSAMAGNDLMSFVNTWPLNSWRETLALLCTFANKDEWAVLCDTLASRLLAAGNTLAATLCYIVAGNIDKTVEIWSLNLKSEDESKTYVDLLQDLMEKTITLALATGQKRFSASLSKLVENYAELLASQGLLSTAMEYLKLLGSDGSSPELTILRDRISFSAESAAADGLPSEQHTASYYVADQSSQRSIDYQTQQPRSISDQFGEGYQQQPFNPTYSSYSQVQQKPVQFQDYAPSSSVPSFQSNSVPSFQPAPPTQMFVPSQAQHAPPPQQGFVPQPASQPTAISFVPSNKPVLKNAEQYQQPTTLGSQLYPGLANPTFQAPVPPAAAPRSSAPPMTGAIPSHKFPQAATTNPSSGFVPMANQGFVPRPGMGPMSTTQPSSPTQAPAQQMPVAAPAAPPPTVQTADTSKVSAELRPVILTLTRLFDETSRAVGGPQANPSKKREIDDNSKKIGALFLKLNGGDISPSVASKLVQLCLALDNGDFASALQLQVSLTTSDWDECNFWLVALKRMIKARSSLRL